MLNEDLAAVMGLPRHRGAAQARQIAHSSSSAVWTRIARDERRRGAVIGGLGLQRRGFVAGYAGNDGRQGEVANGWVRAKGEPVKHTRESPRGWNVLVSGWAT